MTVKEVVTNRVSINTSSITYPLSVSHEIKEFRKKYPEFDVALSIEELFGSFEITIDESMMKDPYQSFMLYSHNFVSITHPNLIFISDIPVNKYSIKHINEVTAKDYELGAYTASASTISEAIMSYLKFCMSGYKIRYRNPNGDGYATTKIINLIVSSDICISLS